MAWTGRVSGGKGRGSVQALVPELTRGPSSAWGWGGGCMAASPGWARSLLLGRWSILAGAPPPSLQLITLGLHCGGREHPRRATLQSGRKGAQDDCGRGVQYPFPGWAWLAVHLVLHASTQSCFLSETLAGTEGVAGAREGHPQRRGWDWGTSG